MSLVHPLVLPITKHDEDTKTRNTAKTGKSDHTHLKVDSKMTTKEYKPMDLRDYVIRKSQQRSRDFSHHQIRALEKLGKRPDDIIYGAHIDSGRIFQSKEFKRVIHAYMDIFNDFFFCGLLKLDLIFDDTTRETGLGNSTDLIEGAEIELSADVKYQDRGKLLTSYQGVLLHEMIHCWFFFACGLSPCDKEYERLDRLGVGGHGYLFHDVSARLAIAARRVLGLTLVVATAEELENEYRKCGERLKREWYRPWYDSESAFYTCLT